MISLKGIEKIFPSVPPHVALQGVDLEVSRGEFLAIFGRSGSGKTTLLNIVGALSGPTSGTVSVDGMDLSHMTELKRAGFRNLKIGFVFQSFHLLPDRTALENVLLPARLASQPVPDSVQRARASLEKVGLIDRADSYPSALSGGQLQRVAIARALMMKPILLLADEPTGNLDLETSKEIIDLFKLLHKDENLTLLVVTHDTLIADNADRILKLEQGRIVEDGK